MFYRVQSVEPKDNFILSVLFTDGVKTEYDIKPLFTKWDVFNNLKTIKGLFQRVCQKLSLMLWLIIFNKIQTSLT